MDNKDSGMMFDFAASGIWSESPGKLSPTYIVPRPWPKDDENPATPDWPPKRDLDLGDE